MHRYREEGFYFKWVFSFFRIFENEPDASLKKMERKIRERKNSSFSERVSNIFFFFRTDCGGVLNMKVRYLARCRRIFDISNGSADAHLEKSKNKKPQFHFGFLFALEFLNPGAPCYVFVYGYVFVTAMFLKF